MILDTVRKFAVEQVLPVALQKDESGEFVREAFDGLAELGMLGISLPEESGGADLGLLSFAVAMEEIGRVCGSTARLLLSQTALCGNSLGGHPLAEEVAGGEKLGAFIGPDAGVLASTVGSGFALQGSATSVTAGMEADLVVVCASLEGEDSLFVLDSASTTREPVAVLGFRASAPARFEFTSLEVSGDTLISRGEVAREALGRVHVAACIGGGSLAVGLAEAALTVAVSHAHERITFGKPLAKQQAVALKIGDSARAIRAARHLVYDAARRADAGVDARQAGNMARLAAVEAAVSTADEAIQILGGYGFTNEYHVERYYRDAKTLEVLGGGAEALRTEFAEHILEAGR